MSNNILITHKPTTAICNSCNHETVNHNKIGRMIRSCSNCGSDDIRCKRLWSDSFSRSFIYQCKDCERGSKGYSSIGKSWECCFCHSKKIAITMIFDPIVDRWINVETGEEVMNKDIR